MATIVEDLPIPAQRAGTARYPWDEWLDGQTRIIVRGEDFHVPPTSLRALIYTRARCSGLRIVSAFEGPVGAPDSIRFRAYREDVR
ncbi:hypothetical protein GCM10009760_25790 [Kitasatospora kazusensis]|uniref:Uncharacterized protein n=1 Tax=Kitasatospora kazusensis TaxID=407974 RepID=A0ABN2ZFQ8_9ACTN